MAGLRHGEEVKIFVDSHRAIQEGIFRSFAESGDCVTGEQKGRNSG